MRFTAAAAAIAVFALSVAASPVKAPTTAKALSTKAAPAPKAPATKLSGAGSPVQVPGNTYHPPGSLELAQWTQESLIAFYPNHTGWDTKYDEIFDKSLKATLGAPGSTAPETVFTFDTWKQLYAGVFKKVSALKSLTVEVQDIVAYPFAGNKGGYVYVTGRQSGTHKDGKFAGVARDASFFVVHEIGGKRKIVEQRESSNYIVQ